MRAEGIVDRMVGSFFVPVLSFSLYSMLAVVCILLVYLLTACGFFCFWISIYYAFAHKNKE